jgi:hypothetical protein
MWVFGFEVGSLVKAEFQCAERCCRNPLNINGVEDKTVSANVILPDTVNVPPTVKLITANYDT